MIYDKRGQTLIFFIVLIPLLLGLMAIVVDTGLVISRKCHIKEVTKMVIKDNISDINQDGVKDKIKKVIEKNKVKTDNLEITILDNKMNIKNRVKVDSIFGAIIGIKEYEIKVDLVGYLDNGKVIIE